MVVLAARGCCQAVYGPRPTTLDGTGAYSDDRESRGLLDSGDVPEDIRTRYGRAVGRGAALVMAILADGHAEEAAEMMERYDPIDIGERWGKVQGAGTAATGRSPVRGDAAVQTGRNRSGFGPRVFVW